LGGHSAAYLMNPSTPATISFGFEYHEVRKCQIDWNPELPAAL